MGLRRAGIRRRGAGGPGARSPPSRVDPIIVRGAEASLVGGEEQRHRGDVGRLDAAVQALGGDDFRLALRRIPLLLPLGLEIGRANVCTPVTNANHVSSLLLGIKK